MDEYLSREFIENYENADIILTLLFAFIDFIILLFSLINLKSKNKKIYLLKYKLISLFIIDIMIRLLYAKKYYKIKSLFKECLFSFLTASQFYFILFFLEQAYQDTKKSKKENFYKALKRNHLCIIFLFVTFPYDKFSYSQKEICFIQCLIIIYCIFVLYSLLRSRIIKIVKNLLKKVIVNDKKFFFCILGAPYPCLFLFISYYILRILFLTIKNPDFIIYSNIILRIIKECSKYFFFLILGIILYILSENKIEKEESFNDCDENNQINNKEMVD